MAHGVVCHFDLPHMAQKVADWTRREGRPRADEMAHGAVCRFELPHVAENNRRVTRVDSSLWPQRTVPKLPSGTNGCQTLKTATLNTSYFCQKRPLCQPPPSPTSPPNYHFVRKVKLRLAYRLAFVINFQSIVCARSKSLIAEFQCFKARSSVKWVKCYNWRWVCTLKCWLFVKNDPAMQACTCIRRPSDLERNLAIHFTCNLTSEHTRKLRRHKDTPNAALWLNSEQCHWVHAWGSEWTMSSQTRTPRPQTSELCTLTRKNLPWLQLVCGCKIEQNIFPIMTCGHARMNQVTNYTYLRTTWQLLPSSFPEKGTQFTSKWS